MILQELIKKNLLNLPAFLQYNTMYLTITGSIAYGCADTTGKSDFDVYGFCIPPKEDVFPHLRGEIIGFGQPQSQFEQYQQHHVFDPNALGGKGREYDFTIFSIVKYLNLAMKSTPNILDSLFTPQECVLHCTEVANMVRENRKLFLNKSCFPKFKGYAYSQMHKMTGKNPEGKRKELKETYGFDIKFALHLVRLLSEIEQILVEGDLDLQRNKEQLKSIRRGEMAEEDILKWASEKERHLETLYANSTLPAKPDEAKIKQLLLNCLEHHYGSLSNCLTQTGWAEKTLKDIDAVLNDIRSKLYS